MDHQKNIENLNLGRTSRIVLEGLKPVLDQCRLATLSEMKSNYRSGEMDQIKMFSKVASLCTLDDIEQRLTTGIRKGDNAAKELNNE